MYIPAYIVFNLFDWGISLQLLRCFKIYNKKGTQNRWLSRIVQSMAINSEVWIEDEKMCSLKRPFLMALKEFKTRGSLF